MLARRTARLYPQRQDASDYAARRFDYARLGSGYGNYRRPLQSLLTRGGYTFQFVGANTEQSLNYHGSDPEQTFSPYQPTHEGYGGFRIEQISGDTPARDDGGVSYPGLSDNSRGG